MERSLVIETWNLGSSRSAPERVEEGVATLLDHLRGQTLPLATLAELIITHDGLASAARARLDRSAGRAITWIEVPRGSDYYQHKNLGFAAATGGIVAFTDGDCAPASRWLESLTAPIATGQARVVAGVTRYPRGRAAPAGTAVDFPLFASPLAPGAVRNFFANNVAFERELFASRRYPEIDGMFHGQCQVLALALQADGIPVLLAVDAEVAHAWPEGARAWLEMRLLRGADTTAFTPHLARAYAPRWQRALTHLGPLPALAVLGVRASRATAELVRDRPGLAAAAAGLAVIAAVSTIDALGALASHAVHRRFCSPAA